MCQHIEHMLDLYGLSLFKDASQQFLHKKYASFLGRTIASSANPMVLKVLPPFFGQCSGRSSKDFLLHHLCPHFNTNVHTDVETVDYSAQETVRYHFHQQQQKIQEFTFSYTVSAFETKCDRSFQACYRHIILMPANHRHPHCCACGSASSRVDAIALSYAHANYILQLPRAITELTELPPPFRRLMTQREIASVVSNTFDRVNRNALRRSPSRIPDEISDVSASHVSSVMKGGFAIVENRAVEHKQPDHTLYSPNIFCTKSKEIRVSQWQTDQHYCIDVKEFLCAIKVQYPNGTYRLWSICECQLTVEIQDARSPKKVSATGQAMTRSEASHVAYMHLELLIDWLGIPLYSDKALQDEHVRCCRRRGRLLSHNAACTSNQPPPMRCIPVSLAEGVILQKVAAEDVMNVAHNFPIIVTHKDLRTGEMMSLFKDPATLVHGPSLGGQANEYLSLLRDLIRKISGYFDQYHPRFQKNSLHRTNTTTLRRTEYQSNIWLPMPSGDVQLVTAVSSLGTSSLSIFLNVALKLRLAGYSFFKEDKIAAVVDQMILLISPNTHSKNTENVHGRCLIVTEEVQKKALRVSLKRILSGRKRLRSFLRLDESEDNNLPWKYESLLKFSVGNPGTLNKGRILRLRSLAITVASNLAMQLRKNGEDMTFGMCSIDEWTAIANSALKYVLVMKRRADCERLQAFRPPYSGNPFIDSTMQTAGMMGTDIYARTNLHNYCYRKGLVFPQIVAQEINNRYLAYFDLPGYHYFRAFGCGSNIADASRKAAMHALEQLSALDVVEFQTSSNASLSHCLAERDVMENILEIFIICLRLPAIDTKLATVDNAIKCTMTVTLITENASEVIRAEKLHSNIRNAKTETMSALFSMLLRKSPQFCALTELTSSHPQTKASDLPVVFFSSLQSTIIRDLLEHASNNDVDEDSHCEEFATEEKRAIEKKSYGTAFHEEAHSARTFKKLPILKEKESFMEALKVHRIVFVSGMTGSGKSTQIPQYVYQENPMANILITQPRRISAISIANRVAMEMNEPIGRKVGYCVRFDQCLGKHINFVTTGVLLQWIRNDPYLDAFTHVIIDEAHEGDANTTLLLLLVKKIMVSRVTLRVIIMTATLNVADFTEYFLERNKLVQLSNTRAQDIGIPTISAESGVFPVDTRYIDWVADVARSMSFTSKQLLAFSSNKETLNESSLDYSLMSFIIDFAIENDDVLGGSILIFLPGIREISDAIQSIRPRATCKTYILHSKTSLNEQLECLKTVDELHVKLIFATNIAESSITIPDVRVVIDFGLLRRKVYSHHQGRTRISRNRSTYLAELITMPASQVNCIQRQGRAGRTKKGVCYRLFTQQEYHNMSPYCSSEIVHIPLDSMTLYILSLRRALIVDGIVQFYQSLMVPPPMANVESALMRLMDMGCVDSMHRITSVGQVLNILPLPPNFARAVVWASKLQCLDSVLTLVAISEIDGIFIHGDREDTNISIDILANETMSDHIGSLNAYNEFVQLSLKSDSPPVSFIKTNRLDHRKLVLVSKYKKQIHRALRESKFIDDENFGLECPGCFVDVSDASSSANSVNLVKSMLCAMYTPNLAIRCNETWKRNSMYYRTKFHPTVKGHSLSFIDENGTYSPFIVYSNMHGRSSQAYCIENATSVPILCILLFAVERKSLYYREDLRLCVVDDWLWVSMHDEVFDIILSMKALLHASISEKSLHLKDKTKFRHSLGSIIDQMVSSPVRHGLKDEHWHERGSITPVLVDKCE